MRKTRFANKWIIENQSADGILFLERERNFSVRSSMTSWEKKKSCRKSEQIFSPRGFPRVASLTARQNDVSTTPQTTQNNKQTQLNHHRWCRHRLVTSERNFSRFFLRFSSSQRAEMCVGVKLSNFRTDFTSQNAAKLKFPQRTFHSEFLHFQTRPTKIPITTEVM